MTTLHPAVENWHPQGNRHPPQNRPAGRGPLDV